ncbi:hypothetical protein [Pseudoduganella sp. OTU4001]|uniref:hypothetical protein n=1 Tax=Pseudoduganella sp. OTU4001 TaxID=3043854 RepID=UPI00313AB232
MVATYTADLGAFTGSMEVAEDGKRKFGVRFNLEALHQALSPIRNAVSFGPQSAEDRMTKFKNLDESENMSYVFAIMLAQIPLPAGALLRALFIVAAYLYATICAMQLVLVLSEA